MMPTVIELLGVGASRENGGWILHRVCARFRRGEVALVVSRLPEERSALLDAVSGRIVPEEGRVWIGRVPVSRDTVRRIRALVADVDVRSRPVEYRSLLWNVLVAGKSGHRALHGLLRLPRKSERQAARRVLERVGLGGRELEIAAGLGAVDQARLALASALVRTPEALVVRDIDRGLDGAEAPVVCALLRSLAGQERLAVLASAATPSDASGLADRLVAIADGLLVFDGHPADFSGGRVASRSGTA
jgi:ABC-type phosphate/phosphonate transport system ATPase subunit